MIPHRVPTRAEIAGSTARVEAGVVPNDPLALCDPASVGERELPVLAISARLLAVARDPSRPVLQRLRLLVAFSALLDDFVTRRAPLRQQLAGTAATAAGGQPAAAQPSPDTLACVEDRARALFLEQHAIWHEAVLRDLHIGGLRLLAPGALSSEQHEAAQRHFEAAVFPALTPLAIDPGHPFPNLRNRSVCVAVVLQRREGQLRRGASHLLAVVQLPAEIPRLVSLPTEISPTYTLLEELVTERVGDLFPGQAVRETASFSTIQAKPQGRGRRATVRLELAADASRALADALATALGLAGRDVHRVPRPVRLADLLAFADVRGNASGAEDDAERARAS